jgi:adenosylhomocysteine nucleosidase
VPLTGLTHFPVDPTLSARLFDAAQDFLDHDFGQAIDAREQQAFGLTRPRVHRGLIASGDQFIHDAQQVQRLHRALPGLLALEMEGAAVAQVCWELGIPCAVLRTISDNANEKAATDFLRFVKSVAAQYAFHIVRRFCQADATFKLAQSSSDDAGT